MNESDQRAIGHLQSVPKGLLRDGYVARMKVMEKAVRMSTADFHAKCKAEIIARGLPDDVYGYALAAVSVSEGRRTY